ncbi:response regulator [Embleya sp. NPDC020630]|uniref:response regulator n=1 Tax=Embleya sp. NPDC020630 TaxID=3363979 RepID=UPI00379CBC64
MNVSPIRVLVADDQELLRVGLRMLMETTADLRVVAEVATGHDAVEATRRTGPDVVLMDVRMPGMDGLEATRRICGGQSTRHAQPRTRDGEQHARGTERRPRVLILTTFDLDEYVYAALRAGASGFLLKDMPPLDVLSAIRVVAAGEALLAPTVTRRLIAAFADRLAFDPPLARELTGLTEREREVLVLIAHGLSNPRIAHRLDLSMSTVKTHVRRLLAKLEVQDRTQLVIIAYETGLIPRPNAAPEQRPL